MRKPADQDQKKVEGIWSIAPPGIANIINAISKPVAGRMFSLF